jgi:DNA-binding NarL/FixJ family response regulator
MRDAGHQTLYREAVPVTVLIVDDQAPFRRAARAVVEATEGFDVVGEVASGEASLETAHDLQPDLVLMDVNLPGINGLQATEQILASGMAKPPVVVVLSTYEAAEYAPRAFDAGAAGYISKSESSPERLEEAWKSGTSGAPRDVSAKTTDG